MPVRFGGLTLDTDIPFADLPASSSAPDIRIRRGPLTTDRGEQIQEWPDRTGRPWLTIFRSQHGYRLSVPELECFIAHDGREIRVQPDSGVSESALAYLLLHQVLPLAASRIGRLVLHACAVEVDGGSIAFIGESGVGKSTLAAAFCRRGHLLVADDALVIETGADSVYVSPTAEALRLWPPMRDLAGAVEAAASPFGKLRARVPLAGERSRLCGIYVLETAADGATSVPPLPAAAARMALLSHLFRLDVADRDESRRIFDAVHQLIALVPTRAAVYPEGVEYLDEVVDVILRDSRPRVSS